MSAETIEHASDLSALKIELDLEIEARKAADLDLRQAQKLESVGRLAAGVAHEINTPVQFVGDSLQFIDEAMSDLMTVVTAQSAALALAPNDPRRVKLIAAIDEKKESVDLDYIMENAPKALMRARDGLARVATIVRAMKEFAYPSQREMCNADLNTAIESTVTVAKNEYKYVADVVCELGDIPSVMCYVGELNQVVLNLIVNASHAIEDRVKEGAPRGRITIKSRRAGDSVLISIEDTGGGIPESVRASIFDPFFTTKKAGRGTGQGLAIAHSVVVEKHGGALTFETTVGIGTTFFMLLPIAGPPLNQKPKATTKSDTAPRCSP